MRKLLETYRNARTLKNAAKVRSYDLAHPMARCCLSIEDTTTLNDAIEQFNRGV